MKTKHLRTQRKKQLEDNSIKDGQHNKKKNGQEILAKENRL